MQEGCSIITCGVLQGSVLGPIRCLHHTADILTIVSKHGLYGPAPHSLCYDLSNENSNSPCEKRQTVGFCCKRVNVLRVGITVLLLVMFCNVIIIGLALALRV